ncbi:MAG TPA: tetratricopeptide repeat protein, partial [Candidatus Sulfotelmatobacter sp.]|nr:tetratricopeptide repeat protein [Candidatus Sulfotelmatobacter sp.]
VIIAGLAAFLMAGCSRPPVSAGLPAAIRASADGRWDEAVAQWKKALAESPKSAALHNNLAVGYEAKGLRQDAGSEYETARKIDPRDDYITANFVRFERAADLVPPASDAGDPEDTEKLPARVSRVSFMAASRAALDISSYEEIIVTNFRQDMPSPDFDLDAWLVDSLATGLTRLYKGSVSRQTLVWGAAARLDDPGFWRSAGTGHAGAVFLTGTVRLTGKTEKALRREGLPKDSPFKLTNRGLAERSRFKAVVECVVIPATAGEAVFRETYEESRTYDVAGQSPEIAFADLFDAIRLRIFRSLLGSDRHQRRYLLSR